MVQGSCCRGDLLIAGIFGGSNSREQLKINSSDNEREVLWRRLSLATVDLAKRLTQAP
jgi:hypothetical protein